MSKAAYSKMVRVRLKCEHSPDLKSLADTWSRRLPFDLALQSDIKENTVPAEAPAAKPPKEKKEKKEKPPKEPKPQGDGKPLAPACWMHLLATRGRICDRRAARGHRHCR